MIYNALDKVKLIGRTYVKDDIRWCAFSGSGVEFSVKCTSLFVTIAGDSTASDDNNRARLGIFVNGDRCKDVMIDEKEKRIEVYAGEEKELVVRVIKLSESAMSTLGIKTIETDGEIKNTAYADKFIEFIGDSITCGYGVDDECELHSFKTSTEDCTKAFAYRTAQKLGVDYSLVSFSGYGVISGYTGDGVINSIELLPPHYEKLGFSYAISGVPGAEFKVSDIAWDFSRQPDVCVINLGTNDASYCKEEKDKQELYIERYIEFLKKVRKNNKEAFIVCCLGIMGDVLYPSMCEAVKRYSALTGDNKLDTVYFEAIRPDSEGYVADYHPRAVTHERCAVVLADKLKNILA